jgi:hypothetical protein
MEIRIQTFKKKERRKERRRKEATITTNPNQTHNKN